MDASGSLPDSQKQTKKFRMHKKYEIDTDIISNLPESVLTSVLSTKWKDTWTKVTNLDLTKKKKSYKSSFRR